MSKSLVTVTLLCASLLLQVDQSYGASFEGRPVVSEASSAQGVDPVVDWNRTLLTIVRTPGAQPATLHSTRSFAILHTAVYDAVNNIDGAFSPYLVRLPDVSRQASQVAAADQAAHDVLVALYPAFQTTLDAQLEQDLAEVPEGTPKTDGVAIGQAVAAQILAFRSNDGSNSTPPPFVSGNKPGDYQLTPPNFAPADFTQWPTVIPFALARADEFRPGPPPALTSEEYAEVFDEVKSLGEIDSKTRIPEDTLIGKFWSGSIQDFWNEIAQTAALGHHLRLAQSARLFALLNISLADSAIALFEAKYTYQFWRPVTAIRLAGGIEGNPNLKADPDWLPLTTKTAPDPSYPGAHSTISAAGAEVLRFFFGDDFTFDVTSEVLPDVERHFTSFSAAAEEAGRSRVFAGQHFLSDHIAGIALGRRVAESIVDTSLLPR